MKVTFWGTRGSLPTSLSATSVRAKIVNALLKAGPHHIETTAGAEAFADSHLSFAEMATYGGNSSCVQIEGSHGGGLLCDFGSGAREYALASLAKHGAGTPQLYNVLLSHLHWDHIMGFPFFVPAFIPGNQIRIHGCHEAMEQTFRAQNAAPNFPVDFEQLGATIEFVTLQPDLSYDIGGFQVTPKKQLHAGDSYGYRIEQGDKVLVYSTDAEHKLDDRAEVDGFVSFIKDADLLIFDAMYSLADAFSLKEDWGHSSNIVGVELCQEAAVKRLCLFHHEPVFDDNRIQSILEETRRLEEITRQETVLKIDSAYDGLVIDL